MIIKDEDFILTPIDDSSVLFDLSLLRVINKGKSNERKEFKIEAYGIPLTTALNKIAAFRTYNKLNKDEIIALKSYINTLVEERNKLHCYEA